MHNFRQLAKDLVSQRIGLRPIRVPRAIRPVTENQGYLLQSEVEKLLINSGIGSRVGHKIGCTTSVMQDFLGIPNPCAGLIFEKSRVFDSIEVPREGFIKLGVECEIAALVGVDLKCHDGPFNITTINKYIDSLMVAIELVDDRYESYTDLGVSTLIGDNFFNSGCILGPPFKNWRNLDLRNVVGSTKINGKMVGSGSGKAVMGNPLNALVWLANSRASRGLGINKGEFVLLGSLVETKWLSRGDVSEVNVEPFGSVKVSVF